MKLILHFSVPGNSKSQENIVNSFIESKKTLNVSLLAYFNFYITHEKLKPQQKTGNKSR